MLAPQSNPAPSQSTNENNWDASAFITDHQAGVWRYLRAIGCDPSLADDLTQETFVAILRRPFTQLSPSASASYLRRVAYHLLVSYRRRQKRMAFTNEIELLDTQWLRWAGADGGGNDVIDTLLECFQRLTSRAQLSLKLRFAEQATRESIADALGITEHGAKNLMQRAKAQLKVCLDEKLKR